MKRSFAVIVLWRFSLTALTNKNVINLLHLLRLSSIYENFHENNLYVPNHSVKQPLQRLLRLVARG